jgi:hypothetical protein
MEYTEEIRGQALAEAKTRKTRRRKHRTVDQDRRATHIFHKKMLQPCQHKNVQKMDASPCATETPCIPFMLNRPRQQYVYKNAKKKEEGQEARCTHVHAQTAATFSNRTRQIPPVPSENQKVRTRNGVGCSLCRLCSFELTLRL